jgi:hypothetical protein
MNARLPKEPLQLRIAEHHTESVDSASDSKFRATAEAAAAGGTPLVTPLGLAV